MSDENQTSRNCANCACSIIRKNVLDPKAPDQMFCRRNIPTAMQVRTERPRLINNEMSIDKKTGKPVMHQVQETAYLYSFTMPDLVCFDGWRPKGLLPGVIFRVTEHLPYEVYMANHTEKE